MKRIHAHAATASSSPRRSSPRPAEPIFVDGFESGDTGGWSAATGP